MDIGRLTGQWIRNGYESFEAWRKFSNSRKEALRLRKVIAEKKSAPFAGRTIIEKAKHESDARFGDPGHWPWLALYAELREEYIEGWLPDDIYTFQLIPKLNPPKINYLSTVKSFESRIFGDFAIQPLYTRVNGQFFNSKLRKIDDTVFYSEMNAYGGEVVLKRDSSPSGKEIEFKQSGSVIEADFRDDYDYVVQPSVKQHAILAEVYSESVNTLRVTTYLKRTGEIDVKHLTLRVGVDGGRIVNVSQGGLCLYLDREGRVMSEAIDNIGLARGRYHPDTGLLFENLRVPSVPDAVTACKENHLKFPYLRFIAWDLYIDTEGRPRMIEWNAVRPDMWVNEALIGPLWSASEIEEAIKVVDSR